MKEELLKTGAEMSKFDEALFTWRSEGKLHGLIGCHVDDFTYQQVIEKIKEKFEISREDDCVFKYIGQEVKQAHSEITIDQQQNIDDLSTTEIPVDQDKSDVLDSQKKRELKAIAGQINWIATQTRPNLAYDGCEISTSVKNSTVEDVTQANKVVRKAKSNTVRQRFRDLGDVKRAELISFSDASLGNLKDGASQSGHIIFLVGKNGNYSPISWQSKKIRRVIKSTLAEETLAFQEDAENCYILRSIIDEIYQLPPEESVQVKCLTDNQSLCDTLYSTKIISDKRLKVDICMIRKMIENKEISQVSWIDTKKQLANCLTKKVLLPNHCSLH